VSVTAAGERVSHREILLADLVEDGRLGILSVTAEALRNSVDSSVAGRPVKTRCYFLTYEIVLESDTEDSAPPPYGEAA
jgi:hypothetical protein